MKPRIPIVLSTLALVVAVLGSTPVGEAAQNLVLPRGSVGTPQLKTNAVTAPKLRKGAVTSLKVANGSLLALDFKAGQLPAGPKGDKGDAGPPGLSELQIVNAESANDSTTEKIVGASCPEGKRAVGGGGSTSAGIAGIGLRASIPTPNGTGWAVAAREFVATASNWRALAYVVCAKTG